MAAILTLESGKWSVENGECRVECEKRMERVEFGECKVESGVESGVWRMEVSADGVRRMKK